jgi:predicted nucleic acid-binding Zn ribbon protein
MIRCPYCSANVEEYKNTCPKCGNKLPTASSKTPVAMYIILIVISLCVLGVSAISIKGEQAGKAVATRQIVSHRSGLIICDECESAGMDISIWVSPSSIRELAFKVPNRTYATILGEKCDNDICYYQVKIADYGTGWITKSFIPDIN